MLDKVKEEYRNKIEVQYNILMDALNKDFSYHYSNNPNVDSNEYDSTKMAYREIARYIYNGVCEIGTLERKKVGSYSSKEEVKFRKVFFVDHENRMGIHYSSVDSRGYDTNIINGSLQLIEIPDKESYTPRIFTCHYIKRNVIDMFDTLIELCFKGKNRCIVGDIKYDFEKSIKDVAHSYLTKVVRDRKINSVLG